MPPKGGTQTAATRQAIGQGMKKTHAAREAKKAKKTAADLEAEQQERTRFIQSMGSRPASASGSASSSSSSSRASTAPAPAAASKQPDEPAAASQKSAVPGDAAEDEDEELEDFVETDMQDGYANVEIGYDVEANLEESTEDDEEEEGDMLVYRRAVQARIRKETSSRGPADTTWLMDILKQHDWWLPHTFAKMVCTKLKIPYGQPAYYRDIYVWAPDERWGVLPTCPCCLRKAQRAHAWTTHPGRKVITMDSHYFVMTKRYFCGTCRERHDAAAHSAGAEVSALPFRPPVRPPPSPFPLLSLAWRPPPRHHPHPHTHTPTPTPLGGRGRRRKRCRRSLHVPWLRAPVPTALAERVWA